MSYETLLYEKSGKIATITFNRPEKYNTIRPPMPDELEASLAEANADHEVRVIIMQGSGKAFCAGFDFSGNLEHFKEGGTLPDRESWDPGLDAMLVNDPFRGPIPKFMSIWRSPKPVIAKVHGWCVGGGSDMALLADLVIASEDAMIGTPYSRLWGCYLSGMWIYRLGLTKVKQLALTGDALTGKEAAEMGLINMAYPREELDDKVMYWADRMAKIPTTQLAAMKMVVNQAYSNMGLATTQMLGCILDGSMRNTPEGLEFVRVAAEESVQEAVARRDGPFEDYSQATQDRKPKVY